MAAHFSPDEIQQIIHLKDVEGLSHKDIAIKLNRLNRKGEPNARAIMTQYSKARKADKPSTPTPNATTTTTPQASVKAPSNSTGPSSPSPVTTSSAIDIPQEVGQLNELSRKQRVAYLRNKLPNSARGKHTFDHILNLEEKELFLEEFFKIINEEDSLTSAEEQQLFTAILHFTLAMRAAKQDRETYEKSSIAGGKHQYIDLFKKDMHDNMKKYQDAMKSLKLSREQRLKDLQRQGTTFLDYAERYSKTDEQAKAAEEIMRLEKLSMDELKRLQANGWLSAGGLPDNNSVSFDGDRTLKTKNQQHNEEEKDVEVNLS